MSTTCFHRQKYLPRLLALIALVFAHSVFAQGYTVSPVPDWVKSVQAPVSDQVDQRNYSYGVAYLLFDQQWRVDEGQQSRFQHFVSKALNTSGVVDVSQISIDFDPVYESVVLHQIKIHRNGRSIDKIDRSRINIIQREKDLESQVYDGSKTLNVFIEDVRPGDSVEYSYVIEGANPVLAGHFSKHLTMRWGVPLGRAYYRVLWPSSRPLHIKNHNTDIEPLKGTFGQYAEYVWRLDQIDELVTDKNTPGWYDPFPAVYLSDIASWSEVRDWALPLYQPVINTPAQKVVISTILEMAKTPEERVLAALRFVQDEVRYLGIEIGVRSQKPNVPDAVIEQRFGDCKDKSRLLVSLLQGMGIEASSALVNTNGGMLVKEALPTPTLFNHAIVLAHLDGKNYWLDPARTHQSGSLDAVYQPDYDYALVVSDQGSGLIKMSDDINVAHGKVVEETFNIIDTVDKPAKLRILSHFEGYYADLLRENLSETNPNQVQQTYLNYMARYFPDIKVRDAIEIADDQNLNRLSLTEHYTIPEIWTESDDERYILVDFSPYLIYDHVKNVETPVRTMPYAVTYPVRYQHTTRILMPEGSSFEEEFLEVEDTAFRFTKKVGFSDDVLEIDYVYESLKDHVKPEDIQSHSENIRSLLGHASYQVHMANPAINFGQYNFNANDINWSFTIVFLLALAVTLFASFKFIYLYDPPYKAPDNIDSRLEGLAGWLVLPGLAIIFTPIRILVGSGELLYVFSAQQWSILEDQLGEGLLITIATEMIFNVVMVVIAMFLIVMFFTRRHTFPRFFIAYFIVALVVTGADLLVVHLSSHPGAEVASSDIQQLISQAVYAVIWILYFMKSARVKATFTRQRHKNNGSEIVVPQTGAS